MGLKYLPTFGKYLPTLDALFFFGKYVGKYSSPMEHLGLGVWVDSNFIQQFSVFLLGLAGLVAEVER